MKTPTGLIRQRADAELAQIEGRYAEAVNQYRATVQGFRDAITAYLDLLNNIVDRHSLPLTRFESIEDEDAEMPDVLPAYLTDTDWHYIAVTNRLQQVASDEVVAAEGASIRSAWAIYRSFKTAIFFGVPVSHDGNAVRFYKVNRKRLTELRRWASKWRSRLRDIENVDPVITDAGVDYRMWSPQMVGIDKHADLHETLPHLKGYVRDEPRDPHARVRRPRKPNANPRQMTLQEISRGDPAIVGRVIEGLTPAQTQVAASYFVDGKSQVAIARESHSTPPLVCEMIARVRKAFRDAGLQEPVRPRRRRVKELSAEAIAMREPGDRQSKIR